MRTAHETRRERFVERMEMAHRDWCRIGGYSAGGTQTWFADRTGIDKAEVSRMVNGKVKIHGYAWASLQLLEEINELRERAIRAEENSSIQLLREAADEARQESERLERKIDVLRDLCQCPRNRHTDLASIEESMREAEAS